MLNNTLIETFGLPPTLIGHALPYYKAWGRYDMRADALYLHFTECYEMTESVVDDDGNIYHYCDDELVAITILHASEQLLYMPA